MVTAPPDILLQHQGFRIVLPEHLYFDAKPYDVFKPDGFPVDRTVQVRELALTSSRNGARVAAYGNRRLLDGTLSTQEFAGCLIHWSQIPTAVRQKINELGGPAVRKWWRA